MESLGSRVTVGDVAARAGVTISEAEEALNALAADCAGSLEVSLSKLSAMQTAMFSANVQKSSVMP